MQAKHQYIRFFCDCVPVFGLNYFLVKLFLEHIWEAGKLLTCRYQLFFFPIDKHLICCSYHVSARKISLSLATTFSVCCNLWNEQTGVCKIMGSGKWLQILTCSNVWSLSAVIYQRSCFHTKKMTKTFSNPLTVLLFQKNGRTIVFFEGVGATK